MNRRAFLATLGLLGAPRVADAPVARRIPRIGVVFDDAVSSEPLRQGLCDLGYVEGKNIRVEERGSARRNE